MMLTALRRQLLLTQDDLVSIVNKFQIIDFLSENYELLHYYDKSYVIDNVLRYIEEQGGKPHGILRTS